MRPVLPFLCALALVAVTASGWGNKKNKEEATQTLEAPPEPPAAMAAEPRRMVFSVAPLSAKGLLSQQTRDILHEALRMNSGMQIVRVRAFVAGTGDVRRVPQIVGEIFAEKKHIPVPVVSVVQAGALPLETAQVSIETVAVAKRDVNPYGLIFVAPREYAVEQRYKPLAPLAEKTLADIAAALNGRGELLRMTCYVSAIEESSRIVNVIASRYPAVAVDIIQNVRSAPKSSVACEAVARAKSAEPLSAPGLALLNSDRAILTGTQVAYGFKDEDARLAFRRLDRVLSNAGASLKSAARIGIFPLSTSIAEQTRRIRSEFLNGVGTGALAEIPFEGLPGLDASFALDAVAPVKP